MSGGSSGVTANSKGCWVDYLLHDQPVRSGKLRLRQVSRLCDNGHHTHVITSRCDLRDTEVAIGFYGQCTCARCRQ
jgi:hypothetical protein